jgi:hypothetical protein
MTRTARLASAGFALGAALVVAAPSVALADGDYPAQTPTVSDTAVQVVDNSVDAPQQASSLAFTGSDAALLLLVGGGLTAAGAGLVVATRRRAHHA